MLVGSRRGGGAFLGGHGGEAVDATFRGYAVPIV